MKKICSKCKQEKDLEDYSRDIRKKDGKKSECKKCHTDMQKLYSKTIEGKASKAKYAKSDKGIITNAKHAKSDKRKISHARANVKYNKTIKGKLAKLIGNHKRRSREKNTINKLSTLEYNIILSLQNYRCIKPECESGEFFDGTEPTLDHIVPVIEGGGLTKNNVQLLCLSCNSKKGTKTTDFRSKQHINLITTI